MSSPNCLCAYHWPTPCDARAMRGPISPPIHPPPKQELRRQMAHETTARQEAVQKAVGLEEVRDGLFGRSPETGRFAGGQL